MSNVITPESPLFHADFAKLAEVTKSLDAGVELEEKAFLGHLNLRGNASDEAFTSGVEKALGVALPTAPCTSAQSDAVTILWLSPDEWLIIVDGGKEHETEAALRANLTGHFAVSDVSGGQTIVRLAGSDSINVLKKSMGYDTHIDNFPVGKVIGTAFSKTSCHMLRTAETEFLMVVRRSFADYMWLWLQQASKEYGLKVIA
ncbi:sarcosine oxidase subunit gamma [Alteromonas lipolytica]|nr:sarcosine oxidase subunit gamma family protein [Alteromonas lipolytica]GGF64148.1 sarcosine oxidase subunit gamma [Alteromonas lipolytica]